MNPSDYNSLFHERFNVEFTRLICDYQSWLNKAQDSKFFIGNYYNFQEFSFRLLVSDPLFNDLFELTQFYYRMGIGADMLFKAIPSLIDKHKQRREKADCERMKITKLDFYTFLTSPPVEKDSSGKIKTLPEFWNSYFCDLHEAGEVINTMAEALAFHRFVEYTRVEYYKSIAGVQEEQSISIPDNSSNREEKKAPKSDYQKSVAIFIKLLLVTKDKSFVTANRKEICTALEMLTSYNAKGLDNAVSALNTKHDGEFLFGEKDFQKVKLHLQLLLDELSRLKNDCL